MGMKEISFVDVLTINGKDPALYKPPAMTGGGAVLVDIEPEETMGEFVGHEGEYAEWSTNTFIFRTKAQLRGCTVYAQDTDTFHFHNGEDCTLPITTGAIEDPAADDESVTRGADEEPTQEEIADAGGDYDKAKAKKKKAADKERAAAKKKSKRKEAEKKAAAKRKEKEGHHSSGSTGGSRFK